MTRELVFHLGDCKTGSTSIQRTLAFGSVACQGLKIGYPTKGNHNALAHSLNRKAEAGFRDQRWSGLRNRIDTLDADVAVISAEVFEFSDPEEFAELVQRHLSPWEGRIRLVAYLRPHAERLISAFAERTKQGFHTGSIEALMERFEGSQMLYFAPRIAKWKAVFGDAYEVRPMIRSELHRQDVVEDFVHWLTQGRPYEIGEVISANESLTTADLAALRALYSRLPDRPALKSVRKALGWNFATLLAALPRPDGAEKPRIHAALAPKVIEAFRSDAEELDRLYFNGSPMTRALLATPEKARSEAQPIEPEAYFDASALRFIHGTADMFARLIEADPDRIVHAMRPPELRPAKWAEAPAGRQGQKGGQGQGARHRPKRRAGMKAGKQAGAGASATADGGAKTGPRAGTKPGRHRPAPGGHTTGAARLRRAVADRLPWSIRHRLRPIARRLLDGSR